jgi:hypothetical protein
MGDYGGRAGEVIISALAPSRTKRCLGEERLAKQVISSSQLGQSAHRQGKRNKVSPQKWFGMMMDERHASIMKRGEKGHEELVRAG